MIRHRNAMQPIVLRGKDAVKAAKAAARYSVKSGRAAQVLKDACAAPVIVKEKTKR